MNNEHNQDIKMFKTAPKQYNYQCTKCEYMTKNKNTLTTHIERDHNKLSELFQCDACPFQTKSHNTSQITGHQREHDKPSVKCLKCSHETATRAEMLKHRKTHINTKRRKVHGCVRCGFEPEDRLKGVNKKQLQMRSHSCDLLKCSFCDFQSHLKSQIDKHKRNEHGEQTKIVYCTTCEYKSNKKSNVEKHIQTVHEGFRISCPMYQCNKKYTQESDLRQHIASAHDIVTPPLRKKVTKCKTCGLKNIRHNNKIFENHLCEKVKCPLCSFDSNYKRTLGTHITQQHKALKILKCEACMYTTESKHKYDSHNETVHQGLKHKTACEICGSRFVTHLDMKKHTQAAHSQPKKV